MRVEARAAKNRRTSPDLVDGLSIEYVGTRHEER